MSKKKHPRPKQGPPLSSMAVTLWISGGMLLCGVLIAGGVFFAVKESQGKPAATASPTPGGSSQESDSDPGHVDAGENSGQNLLE
jgi:hypothetical protein